MNFEDELKNKRAIRRLDGKILERRSKKLADRVIAIAYGITLMVCGGCAMYLHSLVGG